MTANAKVFTGSLHRVQRGHGKRFTTQGPPPPVRRPARVALMLALAHKIQEAIASSRSARGRCGQWRTCGAGKHNAHSWPTRSPLSQR